MPYCPITSTLGFILSPDKKKVLMVHRTFRESDEQIGKYNALGGKLEENEDIASGMIREIKEESNLEVTSMVLRGTINWTNFGPKNQNWLAFIFLINDFTGTVMSKNEEGTLHWIPISELKNLPMWEGDRLFIPLIFDDDPRPFHGFMPYENDHPKSWTFTRL